MARGIATGYRDWGRAGGMTHGGDSRRSLTFTGKSASITFAPNVVIRITPDRHERGTRPPVPPAGGADT